MAVIHGNNGTVYEGGDAVGEVKSFSYDETADTAEDTEMGDTSKSYKAGHTDGSGSVVAHFDPDDGQQSTLVAGASVTLKLRPEGDGGALVEFLGTVIITGLSISVSLDGIVEATFSFTGILARTETQA